MPIKIIDRWLLRQFLQVFFILYISLTGLFVVFDAFTNLDAFSSAAEKHGTLLGLIARYYGYRLLSFFDLTSGMLALVSASFTITFIQRHNELTALMAAGISRARVTLPVILAAIGVSLVSAALRETIVPRFRGELSKSPDDLRGDMPRPLRPRYDHKTGILIRGKQSLADQRCIREPSFLLPQGLDRYGQLLAAENAYFMPAGEGKPAGYLFRGVQQPPDLTSSPSVRGPDGEPAIICPADAPWLKPDECFVISDVDFEQLTGGQGFFQFSSTADMIRGLRNKSLDFGADARVAIHARIIKPLLDITLLFLGLPLVLARDTRNVFLSSAVCMGVTTAFTLAVYGAQYLGSAIYISPHLAAWLPLILFVPVAAALSEPFRK